MVRPENSAAFTVPVGNDRRYAKCSCGHTFEIPVNALSVRCPRCNVELATATRPGIMQR